MNFHPFPNAFTFPPLGQNTPLINFLAKFRAPHSLFNIMVANRNQGTYVIHAAEITHANLI